MAEFHCRYEDHLEQAILGFCINIGCHQTPQFCFQCFNTNQKQHQAQCLGFSTIKELIQEYIQKEHEFYGRLQNFESSFNNFINQMQKKAQNNLKKLQKMSEFLTKGEYLKFKSDIKFFRKYHSKVDETEKSKFITSINSIVSALENIKQDYIRIDDQINALTDDNNQQYMSRAKSYFEKSEQLLREGQFKEALSALNESLSMGYNHDFVYNLKGLILQNLNKLDEAIDCFDLARNINPNSENAHSNLGASLINQGKFTEGLQIIKTTIELNPKNEKAYYLKGFALYKLDKYQESQYAYEEAIKLNNRWDNAYQGKGKSLLKLNKYKEALQCFQTAINLNKNNDEAVENKALSLHLLQKYKDALIIYDQAIYMKKNPIRLKLKADTLLVLGRKEEAKQYYYEALRIGNLSFDQKQILLQLENI